MTDFTNTFGGAAKDAANDTVLGAQFDTQFDNVATHSSTKANKVVGPTASEIMIDDGSGDLSNGGFTITALRAAIMTATWPVGSIYMSTVSTSPATLFGVGTWVAMEDRMLIGASATYAAASTGGSTDAITVAHTHAGPSHTHTGPSHTHTGTTTTNQHRHTISTNTDESGTIIKVAGGNASGTTATTYTGYDSHNHTFTTASGGTGATGAGGTGSTTSTGSSGTNANMPPYEAVYIWKRTA